MKLAAVPFSFGCTLIYMQLRAKLDHAGQKDGFKAFISHSLAYLGTPFGCSETA